MSTNPNHQELDKPYAEGLCLEVPQPNLSKTAPDDIQNSAVLTAALQYYDWGITPIPLWKNTKIACWKWQHLQTHRPRREEVVEWFSAGAVNIGLIMGRISKAFGLDIDGSGGKSTLYSTFFASRTDPKGWRWTGYVPKTKRDEEIADLLMRTSMTFTPSDGRHLLYRYDGVEKIETRVLWKGIGDHEEIKVIGDGAYIVVPPSIIDGRQYVTAELGRPPLWRNRDEMLEMPTGLRKYMLRQIEATSGRGAQKRLKRGTSRSPPSQNRSLTPKETQEVLQIVEPHYHRGARNNIIVGMSGMFRNEGYSLDAACQFALLLANKCGDEEINSRLEVVRRTYARQGRVAGYSHLKELARGIGEK